MQNLFESRAEYKMSKRPGPGRGRKTQTQTIIDYHFYREQGCGGCPLCSDNLNSPQMEPTGEKRPEVYVLGEAPGADEDKQGVQFIGVSGQLLRRTLKDANIRSIRWDNCCRCRPPKNRTPTRVELEHCRNKIIISIAAAKPEVILAVGGTALSWAIDQSSITQWRGKFIPVTIGGHSCWLYPVLHPAFVLRSAGAIDQQSSDTGDGFDYRLAFKHDLHRLAEKLPNLSEAKTESLSDLDVGTQYVRDITGLNKLRRMMVNWDRLRTPVAFDIETAGLRPYQFRTSLDGWLSIAFSDGNATWAVPVSCNGAGWLPEEKEHLLDLVLRFLRRKPFKTAHNLPFELEWLTSIYGHVPPWRRLGWGDTMTQAYVLDGRRDGLDLNNLILHRFGFALKAQSAVDRAEMASLSVGDLLRYNARDAKYTAKLYLVQQKELMTEGLEKVYQMHLRRALTFVKAQQVGLCVDFKRVEEADWWLGAAIDEHTRKIQESREASLFRRKQGSILKPTSGPQLVVLFRDLLKRAEGIRARNKCGYSVDDEALSAMDLPVALDILAMRKAMKLRSTYVHKFGPKGGVVYADGRIHTKFNDLFTVTGRLSSTEPNMQNFPKRKDAWIRTIVVPPEGHVLASFDYGQIEYRVLGIAADDKYIKQTLRDRYDVHLDWAERVAKADSGVYRTFGKDIKKLRTEIKNTWVFPAFYGAHADYIARMLNMNLRACRKLFDVFWEEFSGVRKWQKETMRFYEENGYVECLTGRRRYAPLTRNMIYNTPIQGSAADICLDAMCRLSVLAEEEEDPALQPVLNVHDDLTFYLPKDRTRRLLPLIAREMLKPGFDWVTVPLSVEVSTGANWAEMSSVGVRFSDEKMENFE
jgi:uracil-DNA glycosylase family 4